MKPLLVFCVFALFSTNLFAQEKNSNHESFFQRNQSVENAQYKRDGRYLLIQLKSGEKETYDLNDSMQKAAAVAKYGALPVAPPPPPKQKGVELTPPEAPIHPLLTEPPPPPVRPLYRENNVSIKLAKKKVTHPIPPPPPPKKVQPI